MWKVSLSLAALIFQGAAAISSTARSIGLKGLELQDALEFTYSKFPAYNGLPQETKFTEKLAKDGRVASCWYDLVLKDAKVVCKNKFFHSSSPLLKLCNKKKVNVKAAKNYVIDEVIPSIPFPRSFLDTATRNTNASALPNRQTTRDNPMSHHRRVGLAEGDYMTMSGHLNRRASQARQASQLEGLAGSCQTKAVNCDANDRYRSHDGFCNNLQKPEEGAVGHELIRFFPNAYEDGQSVPRGGQPNFRLPNPRDISVRLHHEQPIHSRPKGNNDQVPDPNYTHMVMQWGQFLDHDITFTPEGELECCDLNVANDPRCFNIDVTGDAFYQSRGRSCISFTRSDARCTRDTARNQFNGITSFIDGSNIYSSSDEDNLKLRTRQDGLLRVSSSVGHGNLPSRSQVQFEVKPDSSNGEGINDYASGDTRVMEQPGLASMHTLFVNEHNRIASELKPRLRNILVGRSSAEQDRILYEETRKIVYSEMQQITYNEFLPVILGDSRVVANNLRSTSRSSYDPNIDPSIRNEFATVAFRFGHTLISGTFRPVGEKAYALRDQYFQERYVSGRGGNAWEDNIEGLVAQPCRRYDLTVTDDVTDFLFVKPGELSGGDLAARNIQRGRDHGIPGYNTLRTLCGLSSLTNTRTAPPEISQANWDRLGNVYGDVNGIDPWTGGLAETPVPGGIVGPTFACIIERQFNFLKFGDRFFFTHGSNNNGRGLDDISAGAVVQRKLSDIICDNTDSTTIQSNAFRSSSNSNPRRRCGGAQHTSNLNLDVIGALIRQSYTTKTSSSLTACQDQNSNCPAWSSGGYCSQQNVRNVCQKSCGVCGSDGKCSSNADCPGTAPYCSQWNYCRPEAKYNANGKSGTSSDGKCSSNADCPGTAPYCSQWNYCRPEAKYNANGKSGTSSDGKCSSNADCPGTAPYCSQWNYCRPEAKYNANGKSGTSSDTGRCRSHYECPSYASCCSQYGYCHAPGDQCYF